MIPIYIHGKIHSKLFQWLITKHKTHKSHANKQKRHIKKTTTINENETRSSTIQTHFSTHERSHKEIEIKRFLSKPSSVKSLTKENPAILIFVQNTHNFPLKSIREMSDIRGR